MTIPALLAAKRVLVLVPEARKAEAVKASLLGPVTEDCPGSILRETAHASLFVDADSAALLPDSVWNAGPATGPLRERPRTAADGAQPPRAGPGALRPGQHAGHGHPRRSRIAACGMPRPAAGRAGALRRSAGAGAARRRPVDLLGVDVRGLFPLNSHNDYGRRAARRAVATGDGDEVEAFVDEWGITQHRPYPHGLYFTAVRHPLDGRDHRRRRGALPLARHGRPAPDRGAARAGARLPGPGPGGHDQGRAGGHLRNGAARAGHGRR